MFAHTQHNTSQDNTAQDKTREPSQHLRIVPLPGLEGLSRGKRDHREGASTAVDALPIGPRVCVMRRALAQGGGVRQRENQRTLVVLRHSSAHGLAEGTGLGGHPYQGCGAENGDDGGETGGVEGS